MKDDPGVKALFDSIEDYGDGDEVGDPIHHLGEMDCQAAYRITDSRMSSSLACPEPVRVDFYEFPNADPDGSNVENFVEDGNVVINVADWIFYMSYEGGTPKSKQRCSRSCQCF